MLALRLDWQEAHRHERSQNKSTSGIDWGDGIRTGIDTNDRRHEASDPVQATRDSRSSSSVGGRENFRRVGVQHTVHDHLEERLQRRTQELDVWILGRSEAEQQDTCDEGRCGHSALTTNIFDINHYPAKKRAWNTTDSRDSIVAIGDVVRRVGAEILGKESVEEGVAHSNTCPTEPDQDSCAAC